MSTFKKLAYQAAAAGTLALAVAGTALADNSIPSIGPTSGSVDSSFNLQTFFQNGVQSAINVVFFLAGAAAIIYLIWAGVKYITAGGDTKKAGEARQAIINAVIGIAVVVGAYTLINIAFGINNTVTSVSGNAATFQ